MNTVLKHDEIVLKVFNNNIVLVNSKKQEKILFAKGIGFGKKPGSIISSGTEIDKVFTIEDEDNIRGLKNTIDYVDKDFFAACEEIIYELSKKYDLEFNERIHIGLIDHLFFAVKRLKNNEEIENPFLIETKTLYKKEFVLADIIAKRIDEYADISIPEGEVGFIALHIHTALNGGNISKTLKSTQISNEVTNFVEERLNTVLDRNSIDYARFCTHLRFAIQRILNNIKNKNELAGIVKSTYEESYSIAEGVAKIIEKEYKTEVTEDEIAFLTVHIERFKVK